MAKNCNTSPFYLQGQSPTIQNQVAIIERFLKKQLPNYAVITVSLNGVDIPKDEFGNVNLEIERINYAAGDGISIDGNVISCTITDTTYTAGENISIDENNVISTTVIDDSTQSNKSTWSSNKINSLIQEFNNFTITVVNQLPVIGEPYVLYLVSNGSEEQNNVNDEYLWIVENNVGRWEKIGTTQITILQSDWHQSDTTAQDYIKNKPTDLVHTSDIDGLLRNDGTVYTGKYLEQVQDLDNFQAPEGKIVQYIGETNSKYINSFNYRKVGTQIVIPVGTEYINIGERWTSDGLPVCGIVPDIYYKTDKTDAISENIMKESSWRLTTYSGGVNVYSDGTDFKVRVGSIGVYWMDGSENRYYICRVEQVNYRTYQGISYPYRIRFTNQLGDDLIMGNISQPIVPSYYLQSEIKIFESLDGKKIYCYESDGQYYVLPLDFDGEHYQAIPYALNINSNNKYYTYGTTQESIDIDTTEWQQCIPPEEDTSHYVLDSDIGWIEH